MSNKILVAYATISGSTGEVARAIGEIFSNEGGQVSVQDIKEIDDIGRYNAVVLGSSIRAGKWLPEALQFLKTHQTDLSRMPVAYFTTCLTMSNETEDNRQTVLDYMQTTLDVAPDTKPVDMGLFAGSLDPNRLPLLRSDLVPQGDYRDWEAIKLWAKKVAPALLTQSAKK